MLKLRFGNLSRVQKRVAKRLFNEGKVVYLAPSRANLNSPWVDPYPLDKEHHSDFELACNAFQYYGCNKELGRDIYFYEKVGDCP